jgi:Coenzyme PQQ synthesis protein D (PqqD)
MIMSVADSTLFCLNEAATVIWRAADGKTPLSELVAQTVCQQFEVEPEVAVRDAASLQESCRDTRFLSFLTSPFPLRPQERRSPI